MFFPLIPFPSRNDVIFYLDKCDYDFLKLLMVTFFGSALKIVYKLFHTKFSILKTLFRSL